MENLEPHLSLNLHRLAADKESRCFLSLDRLDKSGGRSTA